jgi:hypothetical protein
MTIKSIYDKQEDVPEVFRELFTERNGKWELTGVEGIRTQGDIERVQTALAAERRDHKALKDKFAPLVDKDLTQVLADLDRIPELEAAAEGNLSATKIEEIANKRIAARLAPIERERDQLKSKVTEQGNEIVNFQTQNRVRTIHDSVRAEATRLKIIPEALDDVLMLSERVLELAEDGAVVVKDKVGFTPGVAVQDWFQEIQPKRPHWWPATSGSGGRGNQGNGFDGLKNPWSTEHWNLTEQGALVTGDLKKAERMAAAAYSHIGATAPTKKN